MKLGHKFLLSALCAVSLIQIQSASANDAVAGGLIGAATGAVSGKLIGGSDTAVIVGAAVGAVTGLAIGHEMDKSDAEKMERARSEALSYNRPSRWQSDSGNDCSGSITVIRQGVYVQSTTTVCRAYVSYLNINGQHSVENHQACNQQGTWVEVSETEVIYQNADSSYVQNGAQSVTPPARRVICENPFGSGAYLADSATQERVGAYNFSNDRDCAYAVRTQRNGLVCVAGFRPGLALAYDLDRDDYVGSTFPSLRACVASLPR